LNPNDKPLVSVIIACYRQAQYLNEAVDCVLAQTYPAIEIIVVNDGSDDNTEEVAKGYGARIQYVYRANGGISAARNTGIAHARGTYLKFLDADDSLDPEQIAWQTAALAGRTDAVSLTTVRLFRDGHPDQFVDQVPSARNLIPDLFQDDWGGIHGYLVPAELVRAAGGFNESLRVSEDWDLFSRVGLLGPELFTDPRVGAYYRLRIGSLSTNRAGITTTRARLLISLHDQLRTMAKPSWFGLDLLKAEQRIYQGLVEHGLGDPQLLRELLERIKELQKREGFGQYGWRFRLLSRLFGYAAAERIRTGVVKMLKIRPPESLDTGSWRADPSEPRKQHA
jgi:glycosyltransferase involved in cell wall biosynthesis